MKKPNNTLWGLALLALVTVTAATSSYMLGKEQMRHTLQIAGIQ